MWGSLVVGGEAIVRPRFRGEPDTTCPAEREDENRRRYARAADRFPGVSIADARYVSFTTYRRTGEAVATPVWIAPLPDGRAGFTTTADAGKVKRLRNDPRVTVRPCDVRGNVADGAPTVSGTAIVVTEGADHAAAVSALRRKYGIQFAVVHLGSTLKARLGRGVSTAVVVTLDG